MNSNISSLGILGISHAKVPIKNGCGIHQEPPAVARAVAAPPRACPTPCDPSTCRPAALGLTAGPCTLSAPAGWLHPSINVEDPEDGVDLDVIVAGKKQQQDVRVALSNSFGFGGHNSCIMFKAFKE
jgi:hypothetical protein